MNTAAQSPEVANACISYTQQPVQQNDIDEADDDELASIIFEEAVESYDQFKQMGENKLGGKGSKSDGIACNVTDTPVTDTSVTEIEPNDPLCSWVNHDEAVCCTEDQNSFGKDEAISEEVEVIDICSKMSKEYEMDSNIRLTSIVQDVTDIEDIVTLMRKDDVPEQVILSSILSALDGCKDYDQLESLAMELKNILPPVKPRVTDV